MAIKLPIVHIKEPFLSGTEKTRMGYMQALIDYFGVFETPHSLRKSIKQSLSVAFSEYVMSIILLR